MSFGQALTSAELGAGTSAGAAGSGTLIAGIARAGAVDTGAARAKASAVAEEGACPPSPNALKPPKGHLREQGSQERCQRGADHGLRLAAMVAPRGRKQQVLGTSTSTARSR